VQVRGVTNSGEYTVVIEEYLENQLGTASYNMAESPEEVYVKLSFFETFDTENPIATYRSSGGNLFLTQWDTMEMNTEARLNFSGTFGNADLSDYISSIGIVEIFSN